MIRLNWCSSKEFLGAYHLRFAWNRGHMDLALARWQARELEQYDVSAMRQNNFHTMINFVIQIARATLL